MLVHPSSDGDDDKSKWVQTRLHEESYTGDRGNSRAMMSNGIEFLDLTRLTAPGRSVWDLGEQLYDTIGRTSRWVSMIGKCSTMSRRANDSAGHAGMGVVDGGRREAF